MNIGRRFLAHVPQIKFVSDSSSREALIDAMASSYIGDVGYSAAAVFNPELGTMFTTSQAGMVEFLTAIYDYNQEQSFRHETRGKGLIEIVRPVLNLVGCTVPDFVNTNLRTYAVGTGFASRLSIVYADQPGELRARPKLTPEQEVLSDALVHDLRYIAKLKGEVTFSEDAGKWYDSWYESRRSEIEGADARLSGYVGRKPTQVLKVATLLSVSKDDSLELQVQDLERALKMIEALEPGMRKVLCAVGRNIYAPVTQRIIDQLANKPDGLTVRDLLQRNLGDLDSDELRRTITTIVSMGHAERVEADGRTLFRITDTGRQFSKGDWNATAE